MFRTGSLILLSIVAISCRMATAQSVGTDAIFSEAPKQLAKDGAGEGPAWHPDLGLLTSGNGHVMRRDTVGKQSVFLRDAGSNGLLFDKQGRLLMCQPKYRRVARREADGTLKVLAESYNGKKFNSPNDVTVDSKGRVYFSDPKYGPRTGLEQRDTNDRPIEGIYRIDADGKVTRIVTHEVDRPNGLLVTADDRYMFVADNNNNTAVGARKLYRFDLRSDGTLQHGSRKLIYDWGSTRGPDGMCLDVKGRLYVAAGLNRTDRTHEFQFRPTAGIYVFSPEGRPLTFAPIPKDEVTNCAFGGKDLQTLFVTAGGTLWSIRTTAPGHPVWPQAE